MAGLIFRAAAPFHWAGKVYETDDSIDSTGWSDEAIRTFTKRCPVYVDQSGTAGTGGTGGPETDPIATGQVTTERTRALAAESANTSALNSHEIATPAHSAAGVSFSPTGLVVVNGTTVQAALSQLDAWAGARPTNESGTLAGRPAAGSRVAQSTYFATDDNGGTLYRLVGGAWVKSAPGTGEVAGVELGYGELTTSQAVVTVAQSDLPTPLSITVQVGNRPIVLTVHVPQSYVSVAGAAVGIAIVEGATTLASTNITTTGWGANNILPPILLRRRLTPAAGAHTYKVQAMVNTGTLNFYYPGYGESISLEALAV